VTYERGSAAGREQSSQQFIARTFP
jgi:hypothetical protein